MKILALLFAGSMLFNPVSYEQTTETTEIVDETHSDTSQESNETTNDQTILTEEEKAELLQLLEQWVNGEIELDEATIQLIKEKLGPVVEQNVDKILQNYIEDLEERQKVSALVMALFGALCSFFVMLLFTKTIKKNNLKATINNETFSKSSQIMANSIAENKNDIKEMKQLLENNEKSYNNLLKLFENSAKITDKQFNAIMGILKITYQEGATNEQLEEKLEETQKN